MKAFSIGLVLSCTVFLAGCYHATIETGRPASGEVVSKPWATSFILGLVPPGTVETAAKCPNGVSKVETQLSFLNQIVGIVTLGIFTPMAIRVECAAAGTAFEPGSPSVAVAPGASKAAMNKALEDAIALSRSTGKPVQLDF